ncbi:MYXO-CTERM sorting domain-containing protein [Polyangium spumosum]|uniref:MYXO-CTERM sorting domain-containing protein n=1 Tax=Polyangium spumosum TaxID=889282 RepID=A0A6N7Q627_9BACT|nr:MYXO-CTERM sorting domain-containing protein [Polyangium spumosum]MRG98135.1 MYXO-CTERM sorting domain-containing protein [Polyangium spumosum]
MGGAGGSGGMGGSGGGGGMGGSGGVDPTGAGGGEVTTDDAGCGCRMAPQTGGSPALAVLGLGLLFGWRRRARRG